jgi:hypothetical protein
VQAAPSATNAKLTGALEHPGVVPVYGLGTDAAGRPYYAMRFVEAQYRKAMAIQQKLADDNPP